jgi:hypothetical protein
MKRHLPIALLIVFATTLLAGSVGAQEKKPSAYIGVKKCAMCHKTAASGDQYGVWMKSKHAEAFKVLAGDAGKAKAEKLGVADPATSDKCLSCHSTGHAAPAELRTAALPEDGVSCEACHGPGEGYWKKVTMEAIAAGTMDGSTVGLVTPNEKVCLGCHKADNPGHTGKFVFADAVKKIAHPVPPKAPAK